MDNHTIISDELLAKYLDGKTSPEETERVERYLSENDENIEDLAHICAAIEVQHDAENSGYHRTLRRYWWLGASVAAVVVAVICAVWLLRPNADPENGLIAEAGDTLTETAPPPVGTPDSSLQKTPAPITAQPTPIHQEEQSKFYAEKESKTNYATMIYPYKEIHFVAPTRKSLNFQWDSDAVNTRLVIKDYNNNILINKEIENDSHFLWTLPPFEGRIVYWEMTFTFEDGTSLKRHGCVKDENMAVE